MRVNTLIFEPVKTADDIIKELILLKNEQSILRIKENKLIDDLVSTSIYSEVFSNATTSAVIRPEIDHFIFTMIIYI